jgi:hypothetical protein
MFTFLTHAHQALLKKRKQEESFFVSSANNLFIAVVATEHSFFMHYIIYQALLEKRKQEEMIRRFSAKKMDEQFSGSEKEKVFKSYPNVTNFPARARPNQVRLAHSRSYELIHTIQEQ